MGSWLLRFSLAALIGVGLITPARAQLAGVAQWGSSNWQRGSTTLDLDFYNNRYYLNGGISGSYSYLSDFLNASSNTFTPSTNSTYFDSTGTLQSVPVGNAIRNNTMVGAVAGTPGTPPTNWAIAPGVGLSGLTQQIIGTGTQNGINYIDINFSGTTNATSFLNIQFETLGSITASNGQTWADSAYFAIVGGSTANITGLTLNTALYGSGNTYLGELLPLTSWIGASNTLTRYSAIGTISNASVTSLLPYEQMRFNSGAAINITLRIGWPQLEKKSAPSAVVTTSGSAGNGARPNYTYNGSAWTYTGDLLEPAATNGIRNNTMVGAAAYNTTELTNNGTFSGCSGATCTGWTTTVNGGTGSVSFTSGTATLTGDGTNAASIYQAITTVSGTSYTIAVTTGAGNAVTVQAGNSAGASGLLAASTVNASTTTSYQFKATATTSYVQINNTSSSSAATVTTVSVQSAGAFPTNWSIQATAGGLLYNIVGTGTENGINYVDVRWFGTTTSSGRLRAYFETTTAIAAAQGQTWTDSVYLKLSAGSTANIVDYKVGLDEESSGGSSLTNDTTAVSAPTAAALSTYRATAAATLSQATAAYARPFFVMDVNNGVAIDITLRIGMPQAEQCPSAVACSASSVISTSSAAVTRGAESFSNFSRSSVATYFDSTGTLRAAGTNIPRLDYDPTVSPAVPKGVLIEESRTNMLPKSTVFYASYGSITANATTAPDGSSTATLLTEDTSFNRHYAYPGAPPTITAGAAYSYSVFVKAGTRTYALIYAGKNGSPYTRGGMIVNLANGSFTNSDSGSPTSVTNRTVTALPNGWYRVAMTVIIDASSTDSYLEIDTCSNSSTCSYTGDGASGIYVWGQDIESGAFPTSYIPTNGSTVTRSADTFTIPTSAGGSSGWYTAGQGTLASTGVIPYYGTSNFPSFVALDDGTSSNGLQLFVSAQTGGQRVASIVSSNSTTYNPQIASPAYSTGAVCKQIMAFQTNDQGTAIDGTLLTDGTVAVPSFTRLVVGAIRGPSNFLDGYVTRIWYIPTRQPDATLADYTR